MNSVYCSVSEQLKVDPLLEVFDGGDLCLSSTWDVETKTSVVEIFFPDASDRGRAEKALVEAGRIVGLELKPEYRSFPDEDWKYSYRKFFHADEISPRLAVVPPWEREEWLASVSGRAERPEPIYIDPGMAFGTGRHETTRTCLEFIDALALELGGRKGDRSFLDMGTGSGILAFAACKLGFAPVRAFDIDADAVRVAEENAALNGVEADFEVADLLSPHEPARYVAANILGPVLIHFACQISACVKPGSDSRLILSGILERDYDSVREAFERQGLFEVKSAVRGEWKSGVFAFPDGLFPAAKAGHGR